MATELAKAYVQIIPSAQGISGKIQQEIDPEAGPAGESFGGKLVGKIKGVIATAAIGKTLASTISEGANLEQSLGGIETLFKDSADKVKANAAKAYQTAGMSANEYMELTTSFSASLLSSLSNDTSKAADVADMAMTDMSDNANKMGTNMEDIKNAYQGFAKQNYTMLDNLKLGYGGTKTEMERLLADAQKITGVKYDINNLSDVYSAIHVIQGQLDITGTTAKEAATTISGSFNSMKAAAKNVMGQIALGMDIGPALHALGETTITFLVGNLLPAIGNVLSGLPKLLDGITTMLALSMNIAANNAGMIVEQGAKIILGLVSSIVANIPFLAEAALKLVEAFGTALINADWNTIGKSFVDSLKIGIDSFAGQSLGVEGSEIVDCISNAISEQLPKLLMSGVEIISNLANGILENIPSLLLTAGTMITSFVNAILPMLPMLLSAGANLLLNLVNGIINNLPQILSAAATMIAIFVSGVGRHLPQILQSGIEIIGKLAAGLVSAIPTLIGKIPQIISGIKSAFSNVDWGSVGWNIIQGIANGLSSAASMLWDAVKGVLGSFKDNVLSFFGIHSPSRWGAFVGEMIDRGITNGLVKNAKNLIAASSTIYNAIADTIKPDDMYEANIQIRQVSQYNAENARSTQGVDSRNEVLRRVENLENMLKRQDVAAYFYLDKKLVAKTIAEPIRDIIENNKKLDTMLMGART